MKYAIITDDCVEKLYGTDFLTHLQSKGLDAHLFSFPAGELSKTRATKEKIEDQLLASGFSRDTTIIALGGGVVTDLVGFLASTFCRGVDLILIPTTLMGMVDAAIGGKNSVNTPAGKNMIGTIYSPKRVVIEPRFLTTLPDREWTNGYMEMIKAGLIADRDYFETFLTLPLADSIQQAIEIKRRIISRDLQESGLRRLLNFGHTIGHALETFFRYEISHGEAVAAGLVIESRLSYEAGYLNSNSLDLILKQLPPLSVTFDPDELMHLLKTDKKSVGGEPRFVLLKEIGEPVPFDGNFCSAVSTDILKGVLHAVCPC